MLPLIFRLTQHRCHSIGASLEEVGKFTWFWPMPRPVRIRTGAPGTPSTKDWRSWWEATKG